jgi:putative aldouronate transport system substrate-binding protein
MRKIGTLLAVLAIVGILVGCSGKKETSTTIVASNGSNFTGYPINAPDVTITWLELGPYYLHSRSPSAAESPFHTGITDLTGIKIDWIFPTAGADVNQTYALAMAGGTMPDIIGWFVRLQNEAEQLLDEGTIWDLTPYLEKYSPNYYKFLKADPMRDKAQKTDTGKYYRYGFFREEGPFMDTWLGPIIRKDWLDANNLPIPETIDDWDKTLQVFKEKYNAQFGFERGNANYEVLCGAFGAYGMYEMEFAIDNNGEVFAANVTPEYRNYLTKLNEWYTKGYLDPDHLTMDRTMIRSKAVDGKLGIAYGATSLVTAFNNDATAAENGAQWVGIPYPKGPGGVLAATQGLWGIGDESTVITTACPEDRLEYAMRLMDFFYSDEGFLYSNYGKKDVTWQYDSDGKIVFTDLVLNDPDAVDIRNSITRYAMLAGSGPGIQATHLIELINLPVAFEAAKTWFYPNEEQAYRWRLRPGQTYTAEESIRRTELQNTINTYVAEMAILFVTGQRPLSQFDSYVAQLNQMGLPELVQIVQGSVDRWNAR